MNIRLSVIVIKSLIGEDASTPFTHFDILDIAAKRGIMLSCESPGEKITSILKRLVERGVIQRKIIPGGISSNSNDIAVYWIEGTEPQIYVQPPKRRPEEIPAVGSDQRKRLFKPFRTPLMSNIPKITLGTSQPGFQITPNLKIPSHSLEMQKLISEKRELEAKIKDLTSYIKRVRLAKIYKGEKTNELEVSIDKWRSIAQRALERLRDAIGPVDPEIFNNKANGNDGMYVTKGFATPRMLDVPEISKMLGINYKIIEPEYDP